MLTFRDLFLGSVAAAALGFAAPLHAQTNTSLEVFVGYYRPFGHFNPASLVAAGVLPEQPSDLSGFAWGATGHIGARNRLGFAGQLAATIDSRVPSAPTPDG